MSEELPCLLMRGGTSKGAYFLAADLPAEPALRRVDKLAEGGHKGAQQLATYWVGQGVGLMDQSMSAGQVVQAFKEDFLAAYERLSSSLGD